MNDEYMNNENQRETTANTESVVSEPYRYKYENGEKSESVVPVAASLRTNSVVSETGEIVFKRKVDPWLQRFKKLGTHKHQRTGN